MIGRVERVARIVAGREVGRKCFFLCAQNVYDIRVIFFRKHLQNRVVLVLDLLLQLQETATLLFEVFIK